MYIFRYFIIGLLAFFSWFAHAATIPLHQSEVFKLNISPHDANTVLFTWEIKPGYFLYRDRFKLTVQTPQQQTIAQPSIYLPLAATKVAHEETFHIYREKLILPLSILGLSPGEVALEISAQGCSDEGYCYPPKATNVLITIDKKLAVYDAKQIDPQLATVENITKYPASTFSPDPFKAHSWWVTLGLFFGFGILLAFTPCVLPMIPVLSGIIVGRHQETSTRHAFFLSLSYVLSMSFSYALIGAFFAYLGKNIQVLMQSPWVIGLYSLLFIGLALSMFDVYALHLPAAWQTRINRLSHAQAKGRLLSAAIMGVLSTLVLSPCVTAPLIGALSYIAQTNDMVMGSLALFFMGLGIGFPLLLIGTSLGVYLPRAGAWMDVIKKLFGILLFAIAVELLSRIVSPRITLCLWAILSFFSATLFRLPHKPSTIAEYIRNFIFIGFVLYGTIGLIGAYLGNVDPLRPLTSMPDTSHHMVVTTKDEMIHALYMAQQKEKPVFIDFYADWCLTCKALESTLNTPEIKAILLDYVVIRADVTANSKESEALNDFFNVIAPPTLLFYTKKGQELTEKRLSGNILTADLLNALHAAQQ